MLLKFKRIRTGCLFCTITAQYYINYFIFPNLSDIFLQKYCFSVFFLHFTTNDGGSDISWRLEDDAGILVGSAPSGSARGVFFSPRLVICPDLSPPHEMKAAAERFFFLCWLEEPAATGIGGRKRKGMQCAYIQTYKSDAEKRSLAGRQTGVTWLPNRR